MASAFHTPSPMNQFKVSRCRRRKERAFTAEDLPVRGQPFTWRKKCERGWDEVKYYSDRCRTSKRKKS